MEKQLKTRGEEGAGERAGRRVGEKDTGQFHPSPQHINWEILKQTFGKQTNAVCVYLCVCVRVVDNVYPGVCGWLCACFSSF